MSCYKIIIIIIVVVLMNHMMFLKFIIQLEQNMFQMIIVNIVTLWQNSWLITGQRHKKLTSICKTELKVLCSCYAPIK